MARETPDYVETLSAYVAARPQLDEPWIDPLTGWRLIAAWLLVIVGPWVFLYGLGRIIYDLILAWPAFVDMVTR